MTAEADHQYAQLRYFLSGFDNVLLDNVLEGLLTLVVDSEPLSESRFNPFTILGSSAACCLNHK